MRRASRPGVVLCVRWLLRPPPVVLGRSSPDGPRAHRLDRCCVDINCNAHSCAGRHSASCPRQAQEQAAFFRRFSGRRPNAHIARIARVPRAQLPNCRRAHATHVPMRNGIALLRSGRRLRRADIGRRMDAEGRSATTAALMETGGSRCGSAGESDACVWQPASADQLVAERRWGPVGTPAIRAPRADDPPPGCRGRQWRTMAHAEGRGAAARDTTSQQGPVWDPAGCHGERRETRNCGPRGEAG